MKQKPETEKLIANLIEATFAQPLRSREKHLFRESLHSLVRLAKAEQMLEMRSNVEKLTGVPSSMRQKDKKLPAAGAPNEVLQQQFEFTESDCSEARGSTKSQ